MSLTPRILVADDDQALTRTLSWILRTNGYECVPHHTGDGLVERLRADPATAAARHAAPMDCRS
jgi:DNA-binding response OmpR family regulator